MRIVLTGTTGQVGGGAVRSLAAAGHRVHQIVRDAGRAPQLAGVETSVVRGLDDREGLRAALSPGDRVFMVSAWTAHDERLQLHRAFVDAAAEAEVGHLVYLSFINAAPDAAFPYARSHFETEEHIRASGLPFTFLRTSCYEYCLGAFFVDGVVRGPAGRVALVARSDCATALAAVMAGGDHAGRTYDLVGADAPTLEEAADRVGALLGATFPYVREDAYRPGGAEWKEGIRERTSTAITLGEMVAPGGDIRALTGREPVGFDNFVRANADDYLT
jgi:uncharacterized protein YbjT (DUF2867 family)